MNATIAQVNEYRARFDKCAIQGCVSTAVYGRYCEDCYVELRALDQMFEAKRQRKARREGHLYIRFALGAVKRFEWIGTLFVVSVGMAMILIEFAPWFVDVARRFKDVLMWGK